VLYEKLGSNNIDYGVMEKYGKFIIISYYLYC